MEEEGYFMKEVFNDYVQDLETYIMFQIKAEAQRLTPELEAKNRSPISLSMGAPSAAPPKFVIDKLREALDIKGIHSYSSPRGESYLLEAIQKKMKNSYGVDLELSQICSLIGSKEGIANIIRELINPRAKDRDIILIPDPGYASYKEMVKVSGGQAYPIKLSFENNYMPSMEDVFRDLRADGFDEKRVKALIVNYPNNPLGATATEEYLQSVVDFCNKKGILLISDAAYIEMSLAETYKPVSVLKLKGAMDCAVEFYSFSKPYAMTGWRIGWVCGNLEAVSMFSKLKSTIDTGIFKPIQKAAAEVLNSKEGDEYIVEANLGFKKKQDILVKGFKELGWDTDNLNIPEATFYLWLPIPEKYKTSQEFTSDLLKSSGVVVVPGNSFGKYGEGWFRISIVCEDEKLQEVIDRMKADGFCYKK